MNVEDIRSAVRKGELTPQEAVDKFEMGPAVKVKDIPIDDLKINVLDCGFPTLNEYMFFKRNRGELLILGARPSMGKSAFLFQVARHIAKKDAVLIQSLEMDKESIKARLLAESSGQSLQKIMQGKADPAKIREANDQLSELKLYIDDTAPLDIETLMSRAIEINKREKLALVMVDYLQIVKTTGRGARHEEVADISFRLKSLAKQLKCPVLAAAQLNRQCVIRGQSQIARNMPPDFRPELGDLKESGSIEQDADGVLFLSRAEQINPGFREGEADIGIAKQRNGPTGWEVFKWLGQTTRFADPLGDI